MITSVFRLFENDKNGTMNGMLSKEAMHIGMSKTNRNDPCPCGSGSKYKKCCAKTDAARQQKRRTSPGLFPRIGGAAQKKPSIMQTFANKVLKVVTTPSKVPVPGEDLAKASTDRGYGTLEELIGVEGPPPVLSSSDEKEHSAN